jgi:hypothetical protein
MHTLDELKTQREQMLEIEREVLEDITAKAHLLGYELVKERERHSRQERSERHCA